jgi:hypothetical protein
MLRLVPKILISMAAVSCVGCLGGGPSRIKPPKLDPDYSADRAMELYDTNKDGLIAGDELDGCPAFKRTMEEIPGSGGKTRGDLDTNGDGAISRDEIADRIRFFVKSNLGVMKGLGCMFVYKGRGLAGTKVTFEPEPFMADYIEAATGVTDANGAVTLNRQANPLGGVTVGFYKIRLSKPSSSGKETLPAKLNTETTIGQEIVTGSMDLAYGLRYDLK